jgi:hypothetical protein
LESPYPQGVSSPAITNQNVADRLTASQMLF